MFAHRSLFASLLVLGVRQASGNGGWFTPRSSSGAALAIQRLSFPVESSGEGEPPRDRLKHKKSRIPVARREFRTAVAPPARRGSVSPAADATLLDRRQPSHWPQKLNRPNSCGRRLATTRALRPPVLRGLPIPVFFIFNHASCSAWAQSQSPHGAVASLWALLKILAIADN